MIAPPPAGRTFSARRRVRLGDVDPTGRVRLDALARYLQDVATDDATDAGLDGAMSWVLRRLTVAIDGPAGFGEDLHLVTFCAATGSRWAERRTSVARGGQTVADASGLWVSLDPRTGRPTRLTERFHAVYGEAAAGRTVGSHLRHADPPAGARRRPWPLRSTDLDLLGHVNNAIAFAAVEDACPGASHRRVEVEYRRPITAGEAVELVTAGDGDLWLCVGGQVRVSAVVDGQ